MDFLKPKGTLQAKRAGSLWEHALKNRVRLRRGTRRGLLRRFTVPLLALPFALWTLPLSAQVAGGTIQGTISDPSGRAIPEAKITIMNLDTGLVTNIEDNDEGFYAVPNILPGVYEVACSANGFAKTVVASVTLTVGAQQRVDFTMKIGTVAETVVVQDAPPAIDLATSTLSSVVGEITVRELPLNGRDWTQLATLETGVAAIHTQVGLSTGPDRGNRGFGSQLTISGGRPAQNNYRLDGVSINDYSNGAPGSVLGSNLGVDAVEEFSVLTSNYSAEYGRTSGGVINAITKSGTNEFHGTAYEFLRNSVLDARNYFDVSQGPGLPAKPPFKRNQFGASAGGPLIKDRTFLFADYEGDRQSTGISTPITVPTNADWNSANPKIQPLRALFPATDTGNFTSVVTQVINENYFTLRGDHKLTSKDSLVGTYVFDKATETQPDPFNVVLTGNSTKRHIVTAEDTHTVSPTLLNTLRLGFNRIAAFAGQNAAAINPAAQDTSPTFSAVPGRPAPGINIGGGIAGFQGGLGASPNYRFHWNSLQGYDDAFVTRGIHFLKFGFATEYIQDNILASSDANGLVVFPSLLAFLNDAPGRFDAAFPGGITERQVRQHIYALYIQDDIRLRSNLTVNAGLRYEIATVPTETRGHLATLRSPTDPFPVCGVLVAGCAATGRFFYNPTLHNFEPRVGFAWDPFKTGKTSVRGGFGMFDVLPLPYLYSLLVPLSSPFFDLRTTSCSPPAVCSFPDQLFSQIQIPTTRRQGFIDPHPKRNYTMQWNINVQREFARNFTGMVAYVGSRAVHQAFRADDINTTLPLTPLNMAGPIYPGAANPPPPLNPNAGQISSVMWTGDAHYHALQSKLTAHTTSLQAQASYTWGKSIDTGSATVGGDTFLNSISSLPFFNSALRRGPSDFNIVHNFVLSYTWFLPGQNRFQGPAGWFLGGWQLGGVVQLSSGIPFTATIDPNSDPLGLSSTDTWDFPDRVISPDCKSLVNPGNVNNYIKTNCLTIPAAPASFSGICFQQTLPTTPAYVSPPPGQITCTNRRGNLGRNSLTGPPLKNVDFSLFKNFPVKGISETFRIQFRTEIFNIFNHPNFAPPLNHAAVFTQSSADPTQLDTVQGAGQIDSTVTTSRQIQFGLKIIW